jgi:multiple sugar transport system substrate-binding protein
MRRMLAVALGLVAILAIGVSAETVTIRLAGYSGDTPLMQDVLARFVEDKIPGVEVVWEPITEDFLAFVLRTLSAGTAPDIFYVDLYWAETVASTELVEPLDAYMADSAILSKEDLIPVLVDAYTVDGKLYAVSKDFNSLVIFYNKDMFDAMGVAYPSGDDTLATFLDKVVRVYNSREWVGACLNADAARFLPFAFAAGMPFLEGDGSAPFDLPAAKYAADWYTTFNRLGIGATSADIGAGWPGAAFINEQAAVCIEGGWLIPPIRNENPTLSFGTAFLPTIWDGGPRGNYLFTCGYAMPTNPPSGRSDLAFKVIEILTGPEVQTYILEAGHAIPSRVALLDSPYFQQEDPFAQATKTVFEATGLAGTLPFTFGEIGGGAYMGAINEALTLIMQGEATVEEAMNDAAVKLDLE